MMENTSQRSNARPLIFNNKQDIHSFVHANHSQAISVSMPINHQKLAPNYTPCTSLFDRYNKSNLLLRDCDPKDITVLNKNIIIHEQALSAQFIEQIGQIIKRSPQKKVNATSQGFYKQKIDRNYVQEKPSRQFIQNQIFFNYKQMGEIKKKKKEEFLSQIQNRIAEAQKQLIELQHLQDQQKMEMQQLSLFQAKVGSQLTRNAQLGYMKTQIGKGIGYQPQQMKQIFHIHPQMRSNQINQILQDHFKLNEDILELASNARVKSKQKIKEKPQMAKTSLGHTLLLSKSNKKNLISTSKTNKFPKNVNKK